MMRQRVGQRWSEEERWERCNSIRCNLIMAIRCEWMSVSMVIMQKRDRSVLMKL